MQCSRSGCSKQLRAHNSKGVCSSNCDSPDAPPAARARNVKAPTSAYAKKGSPEEVVDVDHAATIANFRTVAMALGFDPDQVLAEAATGWLEAAGAAVKAADEATDEDEG